MKCQILYLIGWISIFLLININLSGACNEAVCGSVVSKCMLTKSCNCNLKTCDCCKECFECLSYLYDECCSCVDLCPKPNATDSLLNTKSHVEEYMEPIPELFAALTMAPDPSERWTSYTFPVGHPNLIFESRSEDVHYTRHVTDKGEVINLKPHENILNCTVAFMSQCNSWNKCKSACLSMGANSYRWFHDGCCECVGKNCINYGINQSKCHRCPLSKMEVADYDDFGQDFDYDTEY